MIKNKSNIILYLKPYNKKIDICYKGKYSIIYNNRPLKIHKFNTYQKVSFKTNKSIITIQFLSY